MALFAVTNAVIIHLLKHKILLMFVVCEQYVFLFLQNRGYCFHNNSLYICLLSPNHKPLFSADKFAIFFKETKSNLQFSACFGCIKTIAACPIQENRSMKNSSSLLIRYNKNALEKVHNNRSLSHYCPNPTFML